MKFDLALIVKHWLLIRVSPGTGGNEFGWVPR